MTLSGQFFTENPHKMQFPLNPDIRKAETLPADFHRNPAAYEASKELIFARSWQWVGDQNLVRTEGDVYPFELLPGCLSEPLFLSRQADSSLRCFSNVCTHRGKILVENPGKFRKLVCGYHGRRFDTAGKMEFMPEFTQAEDFPRPCDHLPEIQLRNRSGFLFASLEPAFDFDAVFDKIEARLGFLPLHEFRFQAESSKDYLVNAHWALYCDNYLEGFHIPFVHADLNQALDYGSYTTELDEYFNLQVGYSDEGTECFDLPAGHPDFGRNVGAYYYWIFPNLMLNFYPWGLSVNVVRPVGPDKCKVSFLTYMYDESKVAQSAGALLDKVEREDEGVVESVQKGIRSRFYNTGRFSPKRETGVHHFHGLISRFIGK